MNLSQRQLRLFVTTAAFGNVTRASEALHISQPALTRAVQEFESQLGVQMFSRTTRRIALTAEGERFLPTAQRLLNEMERALTEVRSPSTGHTGSITLAVGTAFGSTVLPLALKQFSQSNPGVRVRVVEDASQGITSRVARMEADLGIGSPVGDIGELQCQPLLKARLGLLFAPQSFSLPREVNVAELPALPLLREAADTSVMQLLRVHGSELVERMSHGIEVGSLSIQIALAACGAGVAVVSALGASNPAAAQLRFSLLKPALQRELFLIRRRDRRLPDYAQVLVDCITKASRREARLLPHRGKPLPERR